MDDKVDAYPVLLVGASETIFGFWAPEIDGDDRFLLDASGVDLLVARNLEGLCAAAKAREDLTIQLRSRVTTVDFERLALEVSHVREGERSQLASYRFLLEAWNMIDDLLFTFATTEDTNRQVDDAERTAYEKLFIGNELPSVPILDSGVPMVWTGPEIAAVRGYLVRSQRRLHQHSAVLRSLWPIEGIVR